MHARRQIIDAVVIALAGVGTVYAGRQLPKSIGGAPFVLVYGRQERSAPMTMRGPDRRMERELLLAVEIVTTSTVDEDMDDEIASEVEVALANDPKLGGKCKDLWLSSTLMDARAEGETNIRRARLEFTVSYQTAATSPDFSI